MVAESQYIESLNLNLAFLTAVSLHPEAATDSGLHCAAFLNLDETLFASPRAPRLDEEDEDDAFDDEEDEDEDDEDDDEDDDFDDDDGEYEDEDDDYDDDDDEYDDDDEEDDDDDDDDEDDDHADA